MPEVFRSRQREEAKTKTPKMSLRVLQAQRRKMLSQLRALQDGLVDILDGRQRRGLSLRTAPPEFFRKVQERDWGRDILRTSGIQRDLKAYEELTGSIEELEKTRRRIKKVVRRTLSPRSEPRPRPVRPAQGKVKRSAPPLSRAEEYRYLQTEGFVRPREADQKPRSSGVIGQLPPLAPPTVSRGAPPGVLHEAEPILPPIQREQPKTVLTSGEHFIRLIRAGSFDEARSCYEAHPESQSVFAGLLRNALRSIDPKNPRHQELARGIHRTFDEALSESAASTVPVKPSDGERRKLQAGRENAARENAIRMKSQVVTLLAERKFSEAESHDLSNEEFAEAIEAAFKSCLSSIRCQYTESDNAFLHTAKSMLGRYRKWENSSVHLPFDGWIDKVCQGKRQDIIDRIKSFFFPADRAA